MARVVELNNTGGTLWAREPTVGSDGLVCQLVAPRPSGSRNTAGQTSRIPSAITAASFDSTGRSLAIVDERGHVMVLELDRNHYALVHRTGCSGTSIAFSRTRRGELLVGLADNTVQCFGVASGKLTGTLVGHRTPVCQISADRSGHVLTVSSEVAYLWAELDWSRRQTLTAGNLGITQAGFTPDDQSIATAFQEESLLLWDARTCTLRGEIVPPQQSGDMSARHFAFSPSGTQVCSGGPGVNTICLWDVASSQLERVLELPEGAGGVVRMEYMDAVKLAVLTEDGIVRLIDVEGHATLLSLEARDADIVSFSMSSHRCCCIVGDGTALVFDLKAAMRRTKGSNEADEGEEEEEQIMSPGRGPARWTEREAYPVADVGEQAHPHQVEPEWHGAEYGQVDTPVREKPAKKKPPPKKKTTEVMPPRMLSRERLRSILLQHGEYAPKYRLEIWKFLLGLPGNQSAYRALLAKGPHPCVQSLHERYPIHSRRLYRRLERLLSVLAHWSPVVGEASWVPAFVFPFAKLFRSDELACFETCVTLLTNWSKEWFEFFPHPPVTVLNRVEAVLEMHDPKLLAHLAEYGVTGQVYGWSMMQNLFTEVFPRDAWLKMMDHAVSSDPGSFLPAFTAAYCISVRETLMRTTRLDDFRFFFHRPAAANVNYLVKQANCLYNETPEHLLGPQGGVSALVPLPKNSYPIFNAYPKLAVNYQSKQRDAIHQGHQEAERRRKAEQMLEQQSRELKAEEQRLLKAEQVHASMEKEKVKTEEETWQRQMELRSRRDREAWAARMENLTRLVDARKDFIRRRREARERQVASLEEAVRRRMGTDEYEAQARLEEERLLRLEHEGRQRILELETEHEQTAAVERVDRQRVLWERQTELEDEEMRARQITEDEERRTRAAHALRRKQLLAQQEEELRLEEEAKAKMMEAELARRVKMSEVERQRRLRQLAEDEMDRVTHRLADQKEQEHMRLEQEGDLEKEAMAKERAWAEAKARERQLLLDREAKKVELAREKTEERRRERERLARRRGFQEKLLQAHKEEETRQEEEEARVRQAILALEEERRAAEVWEREALEMEAEQSEMDAFRAQLQEARDRGIAEARALFREEIEEARRRAIQEEDQERERHVQTTTSLQEQRRQQLAEADKAAREQVRQELAEAQRTREDREKARLERLRQSHREAEKAAAARLSLEPEGGWMHASTRLRQRPVDNEPLMDDIPTVTPWRERGSKYRPSEEAPPIQDAGAAEARRKFIEDVRRGVQQIIETHDQTRSDAVQLQMSVESSSAGMSSDTSAQ